MIFWNLQKWLLNLIPAAALPPREIRPSAAGTPPGGAWPRGSPSRRTVPSCFFLVVKYLKGFLNNSLSFGRLVDDVRSLVGYVVVVADMSL